MSIGLIAIAISSFSKKPSSPRGQPHRLTLKILPLSAFFCYYTSFYVSLRYREQGE